MRYDYGRWPGALGGWWFYCHHLWVEADARGRYALGVSACRGSQWSVTIHVGRLMFGLSAQAAATAQSDAVGMALAAAAEDARMALYRHKSEAPA